MRGSQSVVIRRVSSLAVGVVAVAAMATGCYSARGSSPVARHSGVPLAYRLPVVGAPGYPDAVYPAAVRPRPHHAGIVTACPARLGMAAPAASARVEAIAIVRDWETRGWAAALHNADRAYWPQVAADWRHHWLPRRYRGPVLYAGPLPPARRNLGVPNPAGWIIESCGMRLAKASYLIVTGSRNEPALQGAWVFIDRRGHLLLYFTY